MLKHRFIIVLFFYCGVLISQKKSIQLAPESLTTGNVYGLIIGISDYQNTLIPDLKYAHNDAQNFYNFLLSNAGGNVSEANIKLFKNENATVSNIYIAKKWLEEVAQKNDQVYFYFAGHGDVESSVNKLGFLLAYDSPYENYLNNAIKIEDLNIMANSLSLQKEANVILITDACHSGKLAGSDNQGKYLVGEQLNKAESKEIRIASCESDQLAQEGENWGGGRGVFSFYLVNGLSGLADDGNNDGIITLQEIRNYLGKKVPEDVKNIKKLEQNPVFTGKNRNKIAIVDNKSKELAKKNIENFPILSANTSSRSMDVNQSHLSITDNYIQHLNEKYNTKSIEDELNFFVLEHLEPDNIIDSFLFHYKFKFIRQNTSKDTLGTNQKTDSSFESNEVAVALKKDPVLKKYFGQQLAAVIHNRVQDAINLYFSGEEAELEKARYYNIFKNGYDAFPSMIATGMKFLDPKDPLYHILELKRHYFTGLVAKIKLPIVQNQDSLLNIALDAFQAAIQLDSNAAYIQNELGVIYQLKNEYQKSETLYLKATTMAPTWAIPWANLTGLYALLNRLADGEKAGLKAISLRENLQNTYINLGVIQEKKYNYLFAEENYRKAIDINDQHFLPFEKLGYLYSKTTQYMEADSFFHEANQRKIGYNFENSVLNNMVFFESIQTKIPNECTIDSVNLLKTDIMGLFSWGMNHYSAKNYQKAIQIFQNILKIDAKNPLVYHYLGKIYYDTNKWEEAEIMFQFAIQYYLEKNDFDIYFKSLMKIKYPYNHSCFEEFYQSKYYEKIEDNFLLASVYEQWFQFDSAEKSYQEIINQFNNKSEPNAAIKLALLYEKQGKLLLSEQVLEHIQNENISKSRLNEFYKRSIQKFLFDGYWYYKLGNMLYELSDKSTQYNYLDTIIYIPFTNEFIFFDENNRTELVLNNLSVYDSIGKITNINLDRIFGEEGSIVIKGTNELITKARKILTPRKEGIYYLLEAEKLYHDKETKADIFNKVGKIYGWAGSKRQSIPYFEKSIENVASNTNVRMSLISSSDATYQFSKSFNQLSYLYDNQQINQVGNLLFAKYLIHNHNFEKSKSILDHVQAYHPSPLPEIQDLMGRLHLLGNQPNDAIRYYTNYLSLNPNNPAIEYSLAKLNMQIGNTVSAYNWLSLAIHHGFCFKWVLENDSIWKEQKYTPQWNNTMSNFIEKKYQILKSAKIN